MDRVTRATIAPARRTVPLTCCVPKAIIVSRVVINPARVLKVQNARVLRLASLLCFNAMSGCSGTFSNDTGLQAASDCIPCPAGSYCDNSALRAPVGECGTGYYCPTGTVDQQPSGTPCPVGHYCPGGDAMPIPCDNGTYVSIDLLTKYMLCPSH